MTIAGSFQSELGCSGDWQPDCAATHLAFDADGRRVAGHVQRARRELGVQGGAQRLLGRELRRERDRQRREHRPRPGRGRDREVLLLAQTHWVTDNRNKVIAVAPGSFQSELGCPGDWDPGCLRSWLQDPDGDGFYSFRTRALPAGSYEVKVAIGESWDENYGAGGVRNGANIAFTVPASCQEVVFTYDAATHVLDRRGGGGARAATSPRARAHWIAAGHRRLEPRRGDAGLERPPPLRRRRRAHARARTA